MMTRMLAGTIFDSQRKMKHCIFMLGEIEYLSF
jgi:hypothetical protein